ncbi:hypothetical protein [Nocardia gamkensis]|uniref:Uncharacterized protein n=1 Tax=Nocardia gamkensis TaxID=352869 RepID=A0A7X6R5M7_9NOCA|nr:hypothetical protein [Nocardia gamkensis]NKY29501.1 hypothetical protein [Nocardia gamkensis]NQE71777.1 hypothetical protein [Nocardia gamkensis]
MGDKLLAEPGEIAGLGKLVADIGDDASKAAKFAGEQCMPADWLQGPIIDQLISPVKGAATATQLRMAEIANATTSTGTELNKAAWMYHDRDQKNYLALNQNTFNGPVAAGTPVDADTEVQGSTAAYVSPAEYPKSKAFELQEPQSNKEDTVALIGEVAPILGEVNESIKSITRTAGNEIDPLGKCLEPIPGNWSEVRRIGEAYKAAGNGMEACGDNLEAGLKKVDPHWNGKAALSFNDWANRQIAAMRWEGPVGRIISDVLGVVADEIRQAVKTILTKLWDILNDQIKFTSIEGIFKTIARKIPVVGQVYEIVNLGIKIFDIVKKAIDLVVEIQKLVDQVKKLLEYIKDPVGKLKEGAEQKLKETIAPFTEKLEKASKATAVATDISKIAQVDSTLNRPKESYEVGSGGQPWEDA